MSAAPFPASSTRASEHAQAGRCDEITDEDDMHPQHHDMWQAIGSRQHFDTPPLKSTLRTALQPPPPVDHEDAPLADGVQAHLRYIARRSSRVARETHEVIERSRSQMAEGNRRLAKAEQVLVVAERRLEQTRTIRPVDRVVPVHRDQLTDERACA